METRKKAALDLSMNTIVVVVIGIVILTLGLRWIYGIFGGLEEQRKQLDEATEQQIRDTFGESDEPLNLLTTTISIEQGKFADIGVGIRNTLSEEHTFRYMIETTDIPSNIQANQVLGWVRWDKSNLLLKSGEIYTDVISIDPKDAPLGIYKLKVVLQCVDPGCSETDSVPLTVRIVAK